MTARTIDLTPTWQAILPALLAVLENGTEQGKRMAQEEFRRMAQALDGHNADAKIAKITAFAVKSRVLEQAVALFAYEDAAANYAERLTLCQVIPLQVDADTFETAAGLTPADQEG